MSFCEECNYRSKGAEEESLNFAGLCAGAVPLSSSLFSLSFCLISLGCSSLSCPKVLTVPTLNMPSFLPLALQQSLLLWAVREEGRAGIKA